MFEKKRVLFSVTLSMVWMTPSVHQHFAFSSQAWKSINPFTATAVCHTSAAAGEGDLSAFTDPLKV